MSIPPPKSTLTVTIKTVWLTLIALMRDSLYFALLCLRPTVAVAAENLFLRKQLALYQEHQIKPQRPPITTRFARIVLAPCLIGDQR